MIGTQCATVGTPLRWREDTMIRQSSRSSLGDDPRVGGEDQHSGLPPDPYFGTPPRQRGGPRRRPDPPLRRRNTPASAGRTRRSCFSARRASEHPRIGGEDPPDADTLHVHRGTPPHRRGGRWRPSRRASASRNTPASAGRTAPPPGAPGPSPEHPRIGGEDFNGRHIASVSVGTPPHRRGGPGGQGGDVDAQRNTPASAGRTARGSCRWPCPSEHPRIGGEDVPWGMPSRLAAGTPPHRRGGRPPRRRPAPVPRNTPASAGRTPGESRLQPGP